MTDFKNYSFGIIKHRNSVNEAVTHDGYKVTRQDKIWFSDEVGFVKCAPYDNHFVYVDPYVPPPGHPGRWGLMCTCGSPAVRVGTRAYARDGSPEGWLIVCHYHLEHGVHATGERTWL